MVGDEIQTDPDYVLWSLDGEAQVLRPHILAVDRDGRTDAILVARLSRSRLPSKLGYATVYAPVVRALSVVHDGLLGERDCGVAEAVLDELFAGLELGVADIVLFRQLPRESPLREAAQARAGFLTRQRITRTDLRWQIDLPDTFDEYVKSLSSATRKSIRRTAAQVERTFGERLSIRRFPDMGDLDTYVRDAESIAARTYQRGLGVGFLDDEPQQARARMLVEHGWFRGYVLYLDGRPVAFEQGEAYRNRFVSRYAGYDPAHSQSRIGAYLLTKVIESLVDDPQISVFDFGFGDAQYKRRLGHRAIEEGDLVVYARRARPISINVVRTGLLGASYGSAACLRRFAMLDASKLWWRNHIATAHPATPRAPNRDEGGLVPRATMVQDERELPDPRASGMTSTETQASTKGRRRQPSRLRLGIELMRTEGLRSVWPKAVGHVFYRRVIVAAADMDREYTTPPCSVDMRIEKLAPEHVDDYVAFAPYAGEDRVRRQLAAGSRIYAAWSDGRIISAGWLDVDTALFDAVGASVPIGPGVVYARGSYTVPELRSRNVATVGYVTALRLLREEGFERAVGFVLPEARSSLGPVAKAGLERLGSLGWFGLGPFRIYFFQRAGKRTRFMPRFRRGRKPVELDIDLS
jgi:hypothetical protein